MDPVSILLGIGSKVIDRLWPDETQRDLAKLELLKMQQSGELAQLTADTALATAQIGVNAEDAKSASVFVSGARPFILWVCGGAFAWVYLLQPFLVFAFNAAGHPLTNLPTIDFSGMSPILTGMLGLSSLRTYEKFTGVQDRH